MQLKLTCPSISYCFIFYIWLFDVTFVHDNYNIFQPSVTACCHQEDVYTGVRFPLPELTARVNGCQKMQPSSRAVNSARELG